MGRPWKFKLGQVVLYLGNPHSVVDRREEGQYRIVPLTPRFSPYGPAFWADSWKLFEYGDGHQRSVQARRNFLANQKLTERGCICECCPHVRIPASEVRLWEAETGTSQT